MIQFEYQIKERVLRECLKKIFVIFIEVAMGKGLLLGVGLRKVINQISVKPHTPWDTHCTVLGLVAVGCRYL